MYRPRAFGPERESGGKLVSDRARCFTGEIFRQKLLLLGVKQRFGAVVNKGFIALIERLWRALKDALGLRMLRPSAAEDLAATVELGLLHYAHFRPHQGLGGATPAEIYFGRTPSHLSAIPPPRGRPGEGPTDPPFRLEYLDAERLLPVLVRKAARKGRQEGQRSTLEGIDVGAPGRKTPANPSSLRANARRNSHCAPTVPVSTVHGKVQGASRRASAARSESPANPL